MKKEEFNRTSEFREQCASQILAGVTQAKGQSAFIGLDGFVDEIVHAVDKRQSATVYERLPTIASMAERVAAAAGKSTNIELVNQRTKLGGNGPIMANALASFGVGVAYLGALGYPHLHPVFESFSEKAQVHSICEPGRTDAVEFLDGKVMMVKSVALNDITWANIQARFGRDRFIENFSRANLIGFVNWTMIPYMSDIWESLLAEICPTLNGPRRRIFFDLADPAKRSGEDLLRALNIISRFEQYFTVTLGLNEKEAAAVGAVLGIKMGASSPENIGGMASAMQTRLNIETVVIHPVTYAVAASAGQFACVPGPRIAKPVITTGAGDHFNSGFCLGKLLGLSNAACLQSGVTTSGYYVRSGLSPSMENIAAMMRDWPE